MKIAEQPDGSLLLAVKVVPGASRQRIVGMHGEAIKVAVTAPPEAGKANRAVCELLAEVIGVPARNVTVAAGASSPFKTIRIIGVTAEEFGRKLAIA